MNMKANLTHLEVGMNALLNLSQSAILDRDCQSRLNDLRAEIKKILLHEVNSARLQSRILWAKQGDANTKFFHVVASARKNQNAIWCL